RHHANAQLSFSNDHRPSRRRQRQRSRAPRPESPFTTRPSLVLPQRDLMSTIATPNQKLLQGVPPNSPERVLINHPTQSATAIDGWKSFFFGLPFFAAGFFVEFIGLNRIDARKNAPNWLVGVLGSFFLLAGLFLIVHGIRGVIRKSAYDLEAKQAPQQPW